MTMPWTMPWWTLTVVGYVVCITGFMGLLLWGVAG
jgi:hypothetical protein